MGNTCLDVVEHPAAAVLSALQYAVVGNTCLAVEEHPAAGAPSVLWGPTLLSQVLATPLFAPTAEMRIASF